MLPTPKILKDQYHKMSQSYSHPLGVSEGEVVSLYSSQSGAQTDEAATISNTSHPHASWRSILDDLILPFKCSHPEMTQIISIYNSSAITSHLAPINQKRAKQYKLIVCREAGKARNMTHGSHGTIPSLRERQLLPVFTDTSRDKDASCCTTELYSLKCNLNEIFIFNWNP